MLERERERNGKYVIEGSGSAGSYHENGDCRIIASFSTTYLSIHVLRSPLNLHVLNVYVR